MTPLKTRLAVAAIALLVLLSPLLADRAGAEEGGWVGDLIHERAVARGANPWQLARVAWCESKNDPGALGDHGHSFGLMQLNDYHTGLLWHFYAVGYTNPWSAWQAADYGARVFAYEWADEGVGPWRWSCW